MYRYRLKIYGGPSTRLTCPQCGGKKEFSPYEDVETGLILGEHVGRCNRENNCGYHYKPKQFFADDPDLKSKGKNNASNWNYKNDQQQVSKNKKVDYIPLDICRKTLMNYETNNFTLYLLKHFAASNVELAVKRYFIGTWEVYQTIFWQIDRQNRVRTGKVFSYDPNSGKRSKTEKPYLIHWKFKTHGRLKPDFQMEQCLFGEHLLNFEPDKSIGIVESEKTAIIASLMMPEFLWLATCGCSNLKIERFREIVGDRKIILFPDSSQFKSWKEKAVEAKGKLKLKIEVSTLLEESLNDEEKGKDYDLADFLLAI
jgi:hypothetical protein